LKQIRTSMMAMDERLDQLIAHLDGVQGGASSTEPHREPALDREEVGHYLRKTEQQWGAEIRTLKQELHQTILAHNHNADLIKHHKDTIDALQERVVKQKYSSQKSIEIKQQLQQLDQRLKAQQKHRKLEPLFERLHALETRVAIAAQGAAWGGGGGYPRMPMGMTPDASTAPPPGIVPPSATAAGAVAPGLRASPKAAADPAATKEKAAFKIPTDEEVAARLSRLAVGSEAAPAGPVTPAAAEGADA